MKAFVVNSFVHNQSGGNPAGVVLLEQQDLSVSDMQNIARKLNFSETAFVAKDTGNSDYYLRFFTPTAEVDLCGHATIASFYMLHRLGFLDRSQWVQRTKAGLLDVLLKLEGEHVRINMRQIEPEYSILLKNEQDDVAKAFSEKYTAPPEIWSTGLKDIMYRVASRAKLNKMTVDFTHLSAVSQKLETIGVHAFAVEDEKIYTRNFAPLYGIDEESATGTSNGALIAYLHHHLYAKDSKIEKAIIQGESMGHPSMIYASSSRNGDHHDIWVGGHCHWVDTIKL